MTVADLLLDMKATHSARVQYGKASERLAENALRLRASTDPDVRQTARSMAYWANWIRRNGDRETA